MAMNNSVKQAVISLYLILGLTAGFVAEQQFELRDWFTHTAIHWIHLVAWLQIRLSAILIVLVTSGGVWGGFLKTLRQFICRWLLPLLLQTIALAWWVDSYCNVPARLWKESKCLLDTVYGRSINKSASSGRWKELAAADWNLIWKRQIRLWQLNVQVGTQIQCESYIKTEDIEVKNWCYILGSRSSVIRVLNVNTLFCPDACPFYYTCRGN